MNEINAIIFDIGNVLLTFNPHEFMHQLFHDEETSNACYELMIQSPEWKQLDSGLIALEDATTIFKQRKPSMTKEIDLFFQRWLDMFHPIHETIQLLGTLKEKGYKLYILSNFIRESFTALRPRLHFLDQFDGIMASFTVGMAKPDREIYEHLLKTFDLPAAKSVFIDDMEINIKGAQSAGIQTILFESPSQLIERFQQLGIL